MNLTDLREAMGLSISQVAEELGVPRQDVVDSEELGSTYLLQPFVAAFPINPAILTNPDIDPFLDSYVQNEVRDRAAEWREKNCISLGRMAEALGMTEEQLKAVEDSGRITKALGMKIERTVGMNRKWLMYGDGRNRGTCILKTEEPGKGGRAAEPAQPEAEPRIAPNREAGERIRAARKAAGMSREELARRLELSVSRIAQMESGYVKDKKAEEVIEMIKPENSGKEVGQQVRDARKAAGMKIKDVAELAGVAPGTMAAMECGHISAARAKEIIQLIQDAPKAARSFQLAQSKEAGSRIRDARKAAGLSQKELGVILRVPESAVSRMELGDVTKERAEEIIRRIHGAPRHSGTTRRVKQTAQVLLGRKIRDARENAGLSQKAFGDLIGLPQSRISLIEKGNVDSSTAAEILRAFEDASTEKEAVGEA